MKIYCDGACSGNPGIGGWAMQVQYDNNVIHEFGGQERDITTNNRMELTAVIKAMEHCWSLVDSIEAMKALSPQIYSDSRYVVQGATEWMFSWIDRDFCKADGTDIENQDLWKQLCELSPGLFTFTWIKGHNGDDAHERVDQLAADLARNKNVEFFYGRPRPKPQYSYPIYLSLVDGVLGRHEDWGSCQHRTSGKSNARYKKVKSSIEEEQVLKGWNINE